MWNKKDMSHRMLRWVPLTLTFDLELWPWIFKVKLYLRNGKPGCHGMKGTGVDRMPWCETLRKWVNWMLHWLGNLWPWIFKVKLYLGNGRLDCHGTKGTGVVRMPWCETLRKWVNLMLCWLGYLWPWIFKVKSYLGNRRPNCHGMKGTGVDRMPWCKTQPLCDPGSEDIVNDGVTYVGVFSSTPLVPICFWQFYIITIHILIYLNQIYLGERFRVL